MTIWQIITASLGGLASIGVIFGGTGFLISQFKGGTKEQKAESSDILSSADQIKQFYKEQNDDYKVIIGEQNKKITDLTREVGEIQGQLKAEKRQNDELKLIFQNRNPEMEQFMKYMVQATKDQAETNKDIVDVLKEIHELVISEKDKNLKVTTTVQKIPPLEPARRAEDIKQ